MSEKPDPSKQTPERRRHERMPAPLQVRFMVNGSEDVEAKIVDVSASGVAIASDVEVSLGDHVIAYIEGLDRFEGFVRRIFDGGFAIEAGPSARQEARLLDKIAQYNSGEAPSARESRKTARFDGSDRPSLCRLPDGSVASCKISDMSLSGAAVLSSVRPVIGAEVQIGRMIGRVVRHTEQGFAVQFTKSVQTLPSLEDNLTGKIDIA